MRDRLPFVFEDLGEQQVKNITRPVRVYRVRDTLTHPAADAPGSPLSRSAGEGAKRQGREAGEGDAPAPVALALLSPSPSALTRSARSRLRVSIRESERSLPPGPRDDP